MAEQASSVSVEEHVERILSGLTAMPAISVRLEDAAGLVLAEAVSAAADVPGFDNSSMDGYAVRRDDLLGASAGAPVVLPVIADIAAGSKQSIVVTPGTVTRIMTGAPVPDGADAVVPIEATDQGTVRVAITEAPAPAAFIRRAGSDVRAGAPVLAAGTMLTARHIAAAAASGCGEVVVYRAPRIGIISTGSELVPAGAPLRRGQIHDSNSHLLAVAVAEAGAVPVRIDSVPDDDDALRITLTSHAAEVDGFVLSGGASVGAYDVSKAVLAPLPTMLFSRVRMQPGKPQGFGRWTDGTPVFALPGNPVSSFVSFELFVRPALQKMLGRRILHRPTREAVVSAGWRSPADRRQYMPVAFEPGDVGGELRVRPATPGGSGSHLVTSLASAEALAVIDQDTTDVREGDRVTVMLLES
ncbi:molybdopterin molybdotransferase MoeA [Parafrigoribacterium mesophilum]|uniref:molybdopterin molybdotransferase MoeA n=1 Tax=Parafrigoribacterium mesophilum TaxID=433646 RepID=UPI0031FDF724